ncbi:Sap, sulfolipid-1-addressing protein [uncultured archaeon]|nr:Sap, sulfolipid-1-addressing protein [uncultured archaeon]
MIKQLALAVFALLFLVGVTHAQTTCNVASGECSLNATGITPIQSNGAYGKPINIVFAYAPGCPHCEALNRFMGNFSEKYVLKVKYLNAVTNQSLLTAYFNKYGVPQSDWNSVPILFVNNTFCVGDAQCETLLTSSIEAFSVNGTPAPVPGIAGLQKLSVLEFTGLALVDSINPCAFAVLIFFLSTLFMRDPAKRYRILLGGISFALGIFAFYMLVGVLLLFGIKSVLAVTDLKSTYIYGLFGALTLVLGALYIYDYFSKGEPIVKIPARWKPRLMSTVTNLVSIPSAFVAGILVTLFLLPCITGPYLVAGSLLKDVPMDIAVLWLGYYNLLFILPMLIITALVYTSFTSVEKAGAFRDSNKKNLRLIAGILLIIVGAFILLQMFGII